MIRNSEPCMEVVHLFDAFRDFPYDMYKVINSDDGTAIGIQKGQ